MFTLIYVHNNKEKQASLFYPSILFNCFYTCLQSLLIESTDSMILLNSSKRLPFPDTDTPPSVSPFPSASTPSATTTMAPTPQPSPQDSTSDLMISTTMDLAAPPQPGANTGQLVGVIVGALVAALSLVLIVILVIFLILLRTRRRSQKLNDVPVPPQPQTDIDSTVYSQVIDSQGIELKNNEAYSLSTTQQIPTEFGDNVAYDQATSQIPTEDNIA